MVGCRRTWCGRKGETWLSKCAAWWRRARRNRSPSRRSWFPTRVRATGSGFSFNAGRVIAATGTFLASGGLLSLFGSYALMGSVMCLVYLLGLVVIAFCPETKGRPLPE